MRALFIPVGTALLSAAFVGVLDRRLAEQDAAPAIEVVDLQQLLAEQVADVSRQSLSVDTQRSAATAYATALSTSLDDVARSDHAVLLVKPAVLVGAVDVTDAVRGRLRLALAANPSASASRKPSVP
jgi:hypothetical protein